MFAEKIPNGLYIFIADGVVSSFCEIFDEIGLVIEFKIYSYPKSKQSF